MSAIDYDLKKIKAFAFDVDGVLSPSTIPLSSEGEPLRMVNIKDGYALQLAVKYGYEIAIITGGTSLAVKTRYEGLGITNIFQGSAKKLPVLTAWMESKGLEPDEVAYMGSRSRAFQSGTVLSLTVDVNPVVYFLTFRL